MLLRAFVLLTLFASFLGTIEGQTFNTVYSFPTRSMVRSVLLEQGRDGNLYGMTEQGGGGRLGTIFKQAPDGTHTVIHAFVGGSADGASPYGGVTLGLDGNFYGTTQNGGAQDNGVLFKITPKGVFTILYSFTGGTDGSHPLPPPIQAADGTLYGSTSNGPGGDGTVYKFTPAGGFSVIYTFDGIHGASPWSAPLLGSDGYLYLTAHSGGSNACGTILKITTAGVLKSFHNMRFTEDGCNPLAPLVEGADGNFYGTASAGGLYLGGTLFQIQPSGTFTTLWNFFNTRTDGDNPEGGLTQASDGNFYGAAAFGGDFKSGTIFQLTLGGVYSQIFSFPIVRPYGQFPEAAPAQHTNGLFYGVTDYGGTSASGSIYSLDVGLGPFVSFVLSSGRVGQTVQILGQGLTGTTSVTFNGVAATYSVLSDTYMTAVVPSGAATGPVMVTTPTGTLTSNKNFKVN